MASPTAVRPERPAGAPGEGADPGAENEESCSMCRPVNCNVCGKTTWAGCGDHVAQVRAIVPPDQWCEGHGTAAGRDGQPAKV